MAAIVEREVGVPRTGAEELILTVRRVSQPSVRDVLLVGLTFSSGAVDAITFLALGKVFTAFMTGNLVFFGLGLAEAGFLAGWVVTSGRPSTGAGDLLVALIAFAMGTQSGAVMSLDVKGVFTTAATASLMFLMSEVAAWADSAL